MVQLILAPLNLGCCKEGPELAPEVEASLLRAMAPGNIRQEDITVSSPSVSTFPDVILKDSMKFPEEVAAHSVRLCEACAGILENGDIPVVLGGDHAVSWGSVAGVMSYYNDLSVIYIDAHGDCNVAESSPTGNIHGMHMAFLMGLGNRTSQRFTIEEKLGLDNILYLGARSLDSFEKELLKDANVYTSADINDSIDCVLGGLALFLKSRNHIHLSIDIDVLDPEISPGTGVPEPDGIGLESLSMILEVIYRSGKVVSLDFVEYNRLLDRDSKSYSCVKLLLKQMTEELPDFKTVHLQ